MTAGQKSIMAHNLPIEKYVSEKNRCCFGNFANVPTTGCIKLKMKVTYVYFYEWMEGMKHIIHNLCTLYTYYTYILL